MEKSNPLAFVTHRSRRFIFRHPVLLIMLVLMGALVAITFGGVRATRKTARADNIVSASKSSRTITPLHVAASARAADPSTSGSTALSADVSMNKVLDTFPPYTAGQTIIYSLTVANAGPDTATAVQVTDTPTNLTITNVTDACSSLPCTIGSIPSGGFKNINVFATINAAGDFDNTATATAAEFDPNTSNNTDSTGNGGTTCSATQTVTNTNDSGAGSLRQALATTCTAGTINFQIPQSDGGFDSLNNRYTITLGGTELLIHQGLTITGPNSGADTFPIIISGGDQSRVLEVSVNSSPVSISNLSFVHGLATGANNLGGGIMNTFFSNTTLTNVTVSNSHADDQGGGITNTSNLTLYGCSVKDNTSTGRGAGIESYGGGTLTAVNSTISGNVGASGGGIDSTISVIVASTISGNSATGGGGGIRVSGGSTSSLLLINSTVSGNKAFASFNNQPTSGGGNAGGILLDNSPATIADTTITNNHADANSDGFGSGGGIFINVSSVSLRNTIVAGNFLGSGTTAADDIHGKSGGKATGCNNLIGTGGAGGLTDGSCGNQVGVSDPKLDALGPYGGPTQTHRLQPTSPAINNGTNLTTLSGNGGSVSDSATSLNVADASSIPDGVGFLIQIENEEISVTSKSGNTLTVVVRGANGTTAASHNDGVAVNPAFDQRGSGFPRNVASAVDIGAFENQCTTPATPTINPSGSASFCVSGTLTSSSATGNQWYKDSNLLSGETNQTLNVTAPGSYTVTVTDSGCTSNPSAATTVSIDTMPPTPTISGTTNGTGTQDQACPEQPLTLHANDATGATSYQWYKDVDPLLGETNSTYQAVGAGTYYVTATNGSCTTPKSAGYVVQNPTPHSPFISFRGQDSSVTTLATCGGSQIIDSDSATGIQWYKDGVAIPGANSQSYTATESGTYTAQLNALGCHSQFGRNVTLTINQPPATPTITPNGSVTFCTSGLLTSSSATGNQWYKDGNALNGETNQTYSATASGNYTVVVTDGNGCTSAVSSPTTVTVQATSITVTNTNDSGAGSLRQAIADSCQSGATIDFDTSGVFSIARTITLTSGELSVGGNLTINGPTSAGVTISGNNASRIFNVGSGKSLLFSNLTIANGKASQGGGILNAGTLTIVSSTLTNNHTTNGANSSGPSVNGGNGGDGGGIYNTGTLKVINSTISGNQPGNGGDASGTDTSGNGGNGSGIFNSGGAVTSINTTITNNKTGANGDNTTTTPTPGPFGNPGTGGGIFTSGGTVILRNTIVAGNFSVFQALGPPRAFANSDDDINGAVDSSSANNLVGVDSGMTGISNGTNGNKVGTAGTPVSAGLNPLSNNGGPTSTHLPQAGSPVLDAGNNTLAKDQNNNDLTTDQRGSGFDRILNGTVEIGAVEVDYGTPGGDADLGVTKSASPSQSLPDTNVTYTITVSNGGPNAATNATLTDPLPSDVTFVSLSSPGGWSCTTPSVGSGGTVSCTNPTLPLTAGAVFTLVVHIVPGATQGNFITNQATVSTSASDPNDENNSSTASTLVIGPTADVGVTKFANSDTSRADRDVVYTITVSNSGPTAAANVTLNDTLPSDMTFVSLSSPGSWSCGTPAVGAGGTVTCSNPSLAVTSGQIFTLVGHIPPSAPTNAFYFNQATVSSSTSDPNTDNNSSPAGTTVVACLTDPVVTTNADSGAGSLRQAISDACAGSTIGFDMTQVVSPITLTSGELLINKNLTITGPGANLLMVQRSTAGGTPNFRVFDIASSFTVDMSGLTISNGNMNGAVIPAANSDKTANITANIIAVVPGGGILNAGTLTLKNIAVNRNSADRAGGISNSGTLTLVNSTVSGNISVAFGGGVASSGATTITNSTLSGNSTNGQGGGVYSDTGGTLTLTNTTITNNRSDSDGSGAEQGGGIFRNAGTVTLKNTLVAGNFRGTSTTRDDISGAVDGTSSFNLVGDGTNMSGISNGSSGNQVGSAGSPINAMLGALANNGGATQTHLPLPSSPAVNSGSNANLPADTFDLDGDSNTAEPLPVDQRGFTRVVGGTVDIGAVETNYAISATAGSGQSTNVNSAFATALKVTVTESGVAQNNVSVTFTAPGSGASGTFPGPSTTAAASTNSSGIATAPTFTANAIGGSYNVVASIGATLPTASFALTNNKLNQTITFASIANKTFGDADFVVSPTASSSLAVSLAATGNCTVTTPAPGTVHLTGAGGCTITASQAGNGTFNAASDVQQSFTIAKGATTTTVSATPNPSSPGQSVTFTATVTSSAGTPTGTVQFKDGGTNIGSAQTLNGSGVATFSTTALTPGVHTITADYSGDNNFAASTGTLSGGQVVGSLVRFSSSTYNTTENAGVTTITVQRLGDLSQAVSVDFTTPDDSTATTVLPCSTANGVASSRCDFETTLGTLRWAAGDGASKTFTVLINQDNFVEGPETLTLTLSHLTGTGATFSTAGATTSTATLTITDDVTEPATNPIDDTDTFVRQHYRDFLNRDPDPSGLTFWKDNIDKCNDPARRPAGLSVAQCFEVQRINTSASFFLSIEFQNTGYFVERVYKAGFGDISPPTVPVPVRFTNFLTDTQQIGNGVIVGVGSWQTQLDNNKTAFTQAFVQRAAFVNRYPALMNATAFVDALDANAGNVLSFSERAALISELSPNPADPVLRADVLKKVAENATLQQREFNRAFVLLEYFGYLRRNPDAAPEPALDFAGYNFWLNKLNQFNGNYIDAEMVKAFLSSAEYRHRFGP